MYARPEHIRPLARWLVAVMALVVLMVGLGGFTRLTESGLSIVEWKLVAGTLPPIGEAAWQAEFAEYQQSPQFKQVNQHFTVGDFKKIFWLEYLHRLLGRIIGMVVILPLLYFTARGMLTGPMKRRGLALAVLVAAQGAVGWIMVASGLVDQPRVAPMKLALHLVLAFVFFLSLLWTYWQVKDGTAPPPSLRAKRGNPEGGASGTTHWIAASASPPRNDGFLPAPHNVNRAAKALFLLIFIQIALGALVAGLDAGLSYNTYPLMDGALLPHGLHRMQPWWLNHLESVLTVQFQHRMGAVAVVVVALGFIAYAWPRVADRRPLCWLAGVLALQFALGVATLLSVVDIYLASAHQLVALWLLAIGLTLIKTYPARG